MITTKVEKITPDLARKYLDASSGNRRIREAWVEQLALMMAQGDWHLSHQGIAFNCDGSLKDGHHRLLAVIKAGVTVTMLVSYGLPDDALPMIDVHARRSDSDAMTLLGMDVTQGDSATGRRMQEGMIYNPHRRLSRPELIRFIEIHLEAIKFSGSHAGSLASHAGIRAAIARAFYSQDRVRLRAFQEVLNTGFMSDNPDDTAAVSLRNVILRNRATGIAHGGSFYRLSLYLKAESCLLAFLERRAYSKVYEAAEELFPLPGEQKLRRKRRDV